MINELAEASHVGMEFDETKVPVRTAVQAACDMLGLDPLFIANEGKMVCLVKGPDAAGALEAMRSSPYGGQAATIGHVVSEHAGMVVARTSIGGTRVVDLPAGELLPRIC